MLDEVIDNIYPDIETRMNQCKVIVFYWFYRMIVGISQLREIGKSRNSQSAEAVSVIVITEGNGVNDSSSNSG